MTAGLSPRQGQTPFDVADEGLVEHLETLQKKQSVVSLRAGHGPHRGGLCPHPRSGHCFRRNCLQPVRGNVSEIIVAKVSSLSHVT